MRGLSLLATVVLAGCLENSEVIEVRADGSVKMTLAAQGDAGDLATGYTIPFGGPWLPQGDDTQRWLATVGPDTGSARVPQAIAAAPWLDAAGKPRNVRLEVAGEFTNAAAIPEWLAPATEPQRAAYSRRTTSLRIDQHAGRTVFTFERVFRARDWRNVSPSEWIDLHLPREIRAQLEHQQPMTEEQWDTVFGLVQAGLQRSARALAERTLLALCLDGGVLLPAAKWRAVSDGTVRAAMAPFTRPRFDAIRRVVEKKQGGDAKDGPEPFAALEQSIRAALRQGFVDQLAGAGIGEEPRQSALARLDFELVALDHTDDLGDETFKVEVRMPGTIVAGNHDAAGNAATFTFRGEDLRDRDVVLRVVSVVE
ncbi:MAG: hypothetical protein WAT39_03070 [Planctomycetota bacterium]